MIVSPGRHWDLVPICKGVHDGGDHGQQLIMRTHGRLTDERLRVARPVPVHHHLHQWTQDPSSVGVLHESESLSRRHRRRTAPGYAARGTGTTKDPRG